MPANNSDEVQSDLDIFLKDMPDQTAPTYSDLQVTSHAFVCVYTNGYITEDDGSCDLGNRSFETLGQVVKFMEKRGWTSGAFVPTPAEAKGNTILVGKILFTKAVPQTAA